MIRTLARMVFVAGVLAVVALSLLPQESLPDLGLWDKLNHAMAYAALALAGGLGFTGLRSLLLVGIGLLILGAGLEIAQAALPSRSPSANDALANLIGISLGSIAAVGVSALLQKRAQIIG